MVSTDNTLLDFHHSSDDTQAHLFAVVSHFYQSLYKSNITDEDRENGDKFLNNLNDQDYQKNKSNLNLKEKYLLKPHPTALRIANLQVMIE